jgi:hypothetical protein
MPHWRQDLGEEAVDIVNQTAAQNYEAQSEVT